MFCSQSAESMNVALAAVEEKLNPSTSSGEGDLMDSSRISLLDIMHSPIHCNTYNATEREREREREVREKERERKR